MTAISTYLQHSKWYLEMERRLNEAKRNKEMMLNVYSLNVGIGKEMNWSL